MKRGKFFELSVLLLILFALPAKADEAVGKVVSVNGVVIARVDDGSKTSTPNTRRLKPGDSVYRKDLINTASDASVKILFTDESIMDIGQSSLFKVAQYEPKDKPENRQVEMNLGYGKIRAAINQKLGPEGKFKIRTRAATMGVRGTEFYVMSDIASAEGGKTDPAEKVKKPEAAKMQVVVTEGKVEVAKNAASGAPVPAAKPVAVLKKKRHKTVRSQVLSRHRLRKKWKR
jgi:hypothetical protein